MKYARIQDGRVAEVLEIHDDEPPLAERFHPDIVSRFIPVPANQESTVAVGWSYSGGKLQAPAAPPAPPPVVPRTVTNFQARAAMMQVPGQTPGNSLFAEVDAALRAGKDTEQGATAWAAWEYANDFYRDGTLINGLAGNFGQSPAEIDALFIIASTIEA